MTAPLRIFIKAPNWIGDAILATPALRLLRRSLPDAGITVMARPWVADIYSANPDIDQLWAVEDKKGWGNFLSAAAKIRAGKFGWGIAFPNSLGAALLMLLGGIKRRVGYARDGRGMLLTDALTATNDLLNEHMVEYYIHLLSPILPESAISKVAAPRELVVPNPSGSEENTDLLLRQTLPNEVLAKNMLLAGFSPGATGGTAKRWLPERFAAVADHLSEKWGAHPVILGSKAEIEVGEEVRRLARHPLTNLAGKSSLRDSIAMFERFAVFVTNDSGLMHLAAAKNVPLVAIFGPTEYVATAPYHPRAILVRKAGACPDAPCMRKDCPKARACMAGVSVEEVTAAVDRQMEALRQSPAPPRSGESASGGKE